MCSGAHQPPIQWAQWNLPPGAKRMKRIPLPMSVLSAEIKNTWIYISIPPYVFVVVRTETDPLSETFKFYSFFFKYRTMEQVQKPQ
jgi:hypothetical protein